MDRPGQAVGAFFVISVPIAIFLASVGLTRDSGTYDPRGWYVAAGALIAFAIFVWVCFFFIWPWTLKANAWRVRTLAEVEVRDVVVSLDPGSAASARPPTDLKIIKAVYGAKGHDIDVTGTVDMQVADGYLDMAVGNAIFGRDPIENVVKTLTIKYELGGRQATKKFDEGSRAVLP